MKTSSSEFDVLKSAQFCDNSACRLYEQTDAGNIKTHCRNQGQVYCNCCKSSPFVVTKGTIFYGLKTPMKKVVSTLQLLARSMGVNNTFELLILGEFWMVFANDVDGNIFSLRQAKYLQPNTRHFMMSSFSTLNIPSASGSLRNKHSCP